MAPLSRRHVCMVLSLGFYFYNFFRMIIFPRVDQKLCFCGAHNSGIQNCIKTRYSQGAKGRCYLHCPSAPGCDVSVPNALRLSLSLDLSCLGSRAVLGGVRTPVGPLGAGVSTGGWGSKPEDFKTFREKTLLKFQPCSLCRTSGSNPALSGVAVKAE